jgi:hypothetical protein
MSSAADLAGPASPGLAAAGGRQVSHPSICRDPFMLFMSFMPFMFAFSALVLMSPRSANPEEAV